MIDYLRFMLIFSFVEPVGYFTAAWTVLAVIAAWHGWRWVWAVTGLAAVGIISVSYIFTDPPGSDWPGVGFVVAALIQYAILIFVLCAALTEWFGRHREKFGEDSVGSF